MRIRKGLGNARIWVLIGGPPCQAYSIMGRSRMKNFDQSKIQQDERHHLYRHYLQILANHQPPVFVMENVKGLLSSKVGDEAMFARIREDLEDPAAAIAGSNGRASSPKGHGYTLYSLSTQTLPDTSLSPSDFIVESERYGIPQCRHRVLLLGVRDDIQEEPGLLKASPKRVAVRQVIGGLPRLRSGLSKGDKTALAWLYLLRSAEGHRWFDPGMFNGDGEVLERILAIVQSISSPKRHRAELHQDEQQTRLPPPVVLRHELGRGLQPRNPATQGGRSAPLLVRGCLRAGPRPFAKDYRISLTSCCPSTTT